MCHFPSSESWVADLDVPVPGGQGGSGHGALAELEDQVVAVVGSINVH